MSTANTISPSDQALDFIAKARGLADTGLAATRALLDDSVARRLASAFEANTSVAETLATNAIAERARLAADTETRPELIRSKRVELRDAYQEGSHEVVRNLSRLADDLRRALISEALPAPSSDTATANVRAELELALARKGSSLQTLLDYAERGGDFASAASSSWAKLKLEADNSGDANGWDLIVETAARSSVGSADESKARAAAALAALTDKNGANPLIQAAAYVNGANGFLNEALEV